MVEAYDINARSKGAEQSGICHFEQDLADEAGRSIYRQVWYPASEPLQASLLVVHGLGEHSGRYLNVVRHLVPRGYAVCAFDLPGHGRSSGTREHVESFADYTRTLAMLCRLVREEQPWLPLILIGHSMGGLVALLHLIEDQAPISGAVLSAPAITVGKQVSRITLIVGRLLSVLASKTRMVNPVDAGGISRDPEVVERYLDDPLVYRGKVTARLGTELLEAMLFAATAASHVTIPLLLLQGSADRVVNPDGARLVFNATQSQDKTLKIYDGLYHEVFNEPEHPKVLADVAAWIRTRLPRMRSGGAGTTGAGTTGAGTAGTRSLSDINSAEEAEV